MDFFTADQHFSHANIIKYCNRPFESVEEMDETLILNHNSVVKESDRVYHLGDFAWKRVNKDGAFCDQLNGQHTFMVGNHDKWMTRADRRAYPQILHVTIEGQTIVLCHYAMRVWHKSHFNSWHLYGHSHGMLPPQGKSWDVGVDNNHFYPVSFNQIVEIMAERPDNPNLVRR